MPPFVPKTKFDRERFEARIGAMKGPSHIVEPPPNAWHIRHPLFDNQLEAYNDEMVRAGYWKRCEKCQRPYNPIWGHECRP